MENFFGTLKREYLYRTCFSSRVEVEQFVAEYFHFKISSVFLSKTALPRLKFGA